MLHLGVETGQDAIEDYSAIDKKLRLTYVLRNGR